MKNLYSSVTCGGMDVHYKFSNVTFRDKAGNIVRRQRLAHPQRNELKEHLSRWPKGLPIVMEASFGWGWLTIPVARGPFGSHRGQVKLLDHLRGQLADVEQTLHKQLETTPLIRRLKKIDGIGLVLSHVMASEIGMIERFSSHKALASYSLPAPRSNDTGEEDSQRCPLGRHLGTRGNRTLKWAFIEAAHGAVRSGSRWRAMFDRVTCGGKKDRNRGYIKVARQLVKVVYVVWSKGVDYQKEPPVRPGCKKRKSRSPKGQLCYPMVHAQTA